MTSLLRRIFGTGDEEEQVAEDVEQLRANQIFTPNSFPKYTYVEREEKKYEGRLRDGLETPGQIISLAGPSKSGKTVLVQRVVGSDLLISVSGAGIEKPEEFWDRVLDWMGAPSSSSVAAAESEATTDGGEVSGMIGIPGTASLSGSASSTSEQSQQRSKAEQQDRRGLAQVVEEIGGSDFVILVDDFHYMSRDAQAEVTKQIKDAAQQGIRIVTASVPHRSDDMVRANPELRGRVLTVDLEFWEDHNLRAIAENGFALLNVELDRSSLDHFVTESAGSPQLMQAICLHTCFEEDFRAPASDQVVLDLSGEERRSIFERTSTTTDFRSLVDVLDSGPKTRGTERKTYNFVDGTEGDVYRAILKAMATDPPQLSFDYDSIRRRISKVSADEEPTGSSVLSSCHHMDRLAAERFPQERVLDWDERMQVLDITDPYLIFYVRWSGRLAET